MEGETSIVILLTGDRKARELRKWAGGGRGGGPASLLTRLGQVDVNRLGLHGIKGEGGRDTAHAFFIPPLCSLCALEQVLEWRQGTLTHSGGLNVITPVIYKEKDALLDMKLEHGLKTWYRLKKELLWVDARRSADLLQHLYLLNWSWRLFCSLS